MDIGKSLLAFVFPFYGAFEVSRQDSKIKDLKDDKGGLKEKHKDLEQANDQLKHENDDLKGILQEIF